MEASGTPDFRDLRGVLRKRHQEDIVSEVRGKQKERATQKAWGPWEEDN